MYYAKYYAGGVEEGREAKTFRFREINEKGKEKIVSKKWQKALKLHLFGL